MQHHLLCNHLNHDCYLLTVVNEYVTIIPWLAALFPALLSSFWELLRGIVEKCEP